MEVTTLSCGKCGAPLTVPGDVRFLACTFCGARLEVKREGGAAFTAVLEKLADDVEIVKLQNELERLDREFDAGQAVGVTPGEGRRLAETPPAAMKIVGAFVIVFGVFWIGVSIHIGAPFFFPLFGVAFVVFAVLNLRRGVRLVERAAASRAQYELQRAELVARLAARGSGGASAPP